MRNEQSSIDVGPQGFLDGSRTRRGDGLSRKHATARTRGVSASCLRAISIFALVAMIVGGLSLSGLPVHAAPTGKLFDHVVFVAMENTDESSVIGCSCAPFINSLAAAGSTITSQMNYGAGAFSGDSISGCSAACYVALMSGDTYGVSDGYSCCLSGTTLVDQMQAAGLSWQAYCAQGCPRGNDHFAFTGFSSD